MKRSATMAALVPVVMVLSACSSGATEADACNGVAEAMPAVARALANMGDARTADDAEVYLEGVHSAADAVAAVDGPAEFVGVRDDFVDALEAFGVKGVAVAAGEARFAQEQAELAVALAAVERYCPGTR